ncbi:CHAT domain-containing protein [Streptomyces katrae]|uniref:CHAT domain-containing protein n=1 Tax=Streptomyces katrae TaxID=68223 RepID=UPI0009A50AF8|nr:CHAT domain-containing protein [Streptomyces katrae]
MNSDMTRAARLAAVWTRINRIAQEESTAPLLEPAALDEARALTEDFADGDTEAAYVLGWFHWLRYQALPEGEDEEDFAAAHDAFGLCFVLGVAGLPEIMLPNLAKAAVPDATELLERSQFSPDPGVLSHAVRLWQRIVQATPADHPYRADRLFNLGIALEDRYERLDDPADLDAIITVGRDAGTAGPADHPDRARRLGNLGNALRRRFERQGKAEDAEEAIRVLRLAADVSIDALDRSVMLLNLALALRSRFAWAGAAADLDAAIAHVDEAAAIAAPDHPERPKILSLRQELSEHRSGDREARAGTHDLVERFAVAVDAATNAADRAERLFDLGEALRLRFLHTGVVADVDAAIGRFREAVAATPPGHPDRARRLCHLGEVLRLRYIRTDRPSDLDAAIDRFDEAVAAAVDPDERATQRFHLGGALIQRALDRRALADVDSAIGCLRQAVDAVPSDAPGQAGPPDRPDRPDRTTRLVRLTQALHVRFELTGGMADLDAVINQTRAAASTTPPDHPGRASLFISLGGALGKRSELMGTLADTDAAIGYLTELLESTPPELLHQVGVLNNLGMALRARFDRTGALEDLDAAVDHFRAAEEAAEDDDERSVPLTNLGNALRHRSERLATAGDADAAVASLTRAVTLTPAGHPQRAVRLSKLGMALRSRYDRTNRVADLDGAINCFTEAASHAGGTPGLAGILTNLGGALQRRFELTRSPADLDAAIDRLAKAVAAAPADSLERVAMLNNLGGALQRRFELTESPADLDAAIDHLTETVSAVPAHHPDYALGLSNLAGSLLTRYQRTQQPADLREAISCRLAASKVRSATPGRRIMEAAQAAGLLAASGDPAAAANAAESAVLLLPQVAPRRLERGDQQYAMAHFSGLVGDAAALALAAPGGTPAGRAERALGLLETGRAVLLSQALETRNDLTDLRKHHRELAERFSDLRERLDSPADAAAPGSAVPGPTSRGTATDGPAADGPPRERHLLARDFADLLTEIRALDRFQNFGLPPAPAELRDEATDGPVVVFNTSAYRSDALLVTERGIRTLNLPNLALQPLAERIDTFLRAQRDTSSPDQAERVAAEAVMSEVLRWLWDAATGPVLHALGFHGQPGDTKDWPRVWWVPGGLLGLLPLHAAGHHDDPRDRPDRRTVMDRVVSSYTPTIRALRHARERARTAAAAGPARSLVVAMPTTPGLPRDGRLRHVGKEAAVLLERLPAPVLLREPGPGEDPAGRGLPVPTKAAVLEQLPDCSIAHFCCHGSSNPADPSRSLLLLHDHADDPLTVAGLAAVELGRARLAYLSACRTAAVDTAELLDEAIHLTSAFQLVGFPHVIGTLWEIDDELAVTVAELFYDALGNGTGGLDPDRSAYALHRAVRLIRDGYDLPASMDLSGLPSLWAAYLHSGA